MKKLEIKIGHRFGNLTVLNEQPVQKLPSGQNVRVFRCECICGNIKEVKLVHLNRGRIISCGCKSITKGGEGGSHLCKLWRSLKYRTSEKYINKNCYFDKGIVVCDEWKNNWESFKHWALENGYHRELQIDRIDNSKGYFPENCRFVTLKQNVNNRDCTVFVQYAGKKQALTECLESLQKENMYEIIYNRMRRGWDFERALNTLPRIGNYRRKV